MSACTATINLATPVRSERVRDFQPPWRTVFVYTCHTCGAEHRVRACSFRGLRRTPSGRLVPIHAEPGRGGIVCGRPLPQGD